MMRRTAAVQITGIYANCPDCGGCLTDPVELTNWIDPRDKAPGDTFKCELCGQNWKLPAWVHQWATERGNR